MNEIFNARLIRGEALLLMSKYCILLLVCVSLMFV